MVGHKWLVSLAESEAAGAGELFIVLHLLPSFQFQIMVNGVKVTRGDLAH